MHGIVQCCRTAALKVGPATAPNEQCITGKDGLLAMQHITDASLGVARRVAHFQLHLATLDNVAMLKLNVGLGLIRRSQARCHCRETGA